MIATFVDTYYLLALFSSNDAGHESAVAATKTIRGILVTTDWILTETADALSDPANRAGCAQLINDLRKSAQVEIVPASRELFNAGFLLYCDRPDKGWSLTDCISFVVMRERSILAALTGDHHFEQAGFQALLK